MTNASLVHHQLAHLLIKGSACFGEILGAQRSSSGFLLLYSIFNKSLITGVRLFVIRNSFSSVMIE